MLSRGYRTYAHRHNLGHFTFVPYAPVLVHFVLLFCPFNRIQPLTLTVIHFFFLVRRRSQVDVEEFGFLEKIFSKTKPEERTWAKLVNLKTIHWYCDGLEPTLATLKYEAKIRKRKSVIFTLLKQS